VSRRAFLALLAAAPLLAAQQVQRQSAHAEEDVWRGHRTRLFDAAAGDVAPVSATATAGRGQGRQPIRVHIFGRGEEDEEWLDEEAKGEAEAEVKTESVEIPEPLGTFASQIRERRRAEERQRRQRRLEQRQQRRLEEKSLPSGGISTAYPVEARWDQAPVDYFDAITLRPDKPLGVAFIESLQLAGIVAAAIATVAAISSVSERAEGVPLEYDRKAIARYCHVRPELVIGRLFRYMWEIVRYCSPALRDAVLDSLPSLDGARRSGKSRTDARRLRRRLRARRLREGVTRLGPGIIKLGQAASTRPDLIGNTFASELQILQDSLFQGFPSNEAFALIRKELNASPSAIFAYIDPTPVAGASLGMVFRAWLHEDERDTGGLLTEIHDADTPEWLRGKRKVAVKVQRPFVAQLMTLDFYIVRVLAKAYGSFFQVRTDLGQAVDEYALSAFEELNYRLEASNMQRFRELYGKLPGIYVPQVYSVYCSRRILTTEWIVGDKLTDSSTHVRSQDVELVKVGVRAALEQCLSGGFMQLDCHSGNLLRSRDDDSLSTPLLIL
jgi:ABC1 atypical kinase-like domain